MIIFQKLVFMKDVKLLENDENPNSAGNLIVTTASELKKVRDQILKIKEVKERVLRFEELRDKLFGPLTAVIANV